MIYKEKSYYKKEKDLFKTNEFWGQKTQNAFVKYKREALMFCIYCGGNAITKEHCPTRGLMLKPRPFDLPTLPACEKCNNSFSSDEMYTVSLVKALNTFLNNGEETGLEMNISTRQEVNDAKKEAEFIAKSGYYRDDKRLRNTLIKLAVGHAIFELTIGYAGQLYKEADINVEYYFRHFISPDKWEKFNQLEVIETNNIPEIGSRLFRNIYVVSVKRKKESGRKIKTECIALDWTNVQEGKYKYIALLKGNEIVVKIFIWNTIYAKVTFFLSESHITLSNIKRGEVRCE